MNLSQVEDLFWSEFHAGDWGTIFHWFPKSQMQGTTVTSDCDFYQRSSLLVQAPLDVIDKFLVRNSLAQLFRFLESELKEKVPPALPSDHLEGLIGTEVLILGPLSFITHFKGKTAPFQNKFHICSHMEPRTVLVVPQVTKLELMSTSVDIKEGRKGLINMTLEGQVAVSGSSEIWKIEV